jgi:tetratricopeptide (TPR) repeat protein
LRVPKYNPAFLDATERARRYGARYHDLEELVRILRENLQRSRNQHVLVVGPRGIGKTTLLLRAVDELQADPSLSSAWLPLVAPEETYRAGTIGEFWLEMVFNLHTVTGDPRHERAYEELRSSYDKPGSKEDDSRLATAALGYLLDLADRMQRRFVLVVENLQMLFGDQLSDRDAWAFRETLIGERRIMVLGSAVSSFPEIEDPKAPLFEQFLVHKLDLLDTGGCLDLWQRLTGESIPKRRMRALEILTGGNPRLLVILAEFAARLSLRELTSDLANLIDDHTDYLKMTTEALPALERRVFVTLAEIWDYASAAEISSQARLSPSVVSAQLNRLVGRGAVFARRRGRGKQYRVAERLYGIYHLMRRRGGVAARARATTEFMVAYYDGQELLRQVQSIAQEALDLSPEERVEHLWVVGALLESPILARQRSEILARFPQELAQSDELPETLRRWLGQSDGLVESAQGEDAARVHATLLPELFEEATQALQNVRDGDLVKGITALREFLAQGNATPAAQSTPGGVVVAFAASALAILEHDLESITRAQAVLGHALSLLRADGDRGPAAVWFGPLLSLGLTMQGALASKIGQDSEAEILLSEALQADPMNVPARYLLALILFGLGRFAEVVEHLCELTSSDDLSDRRVEAAIRTSLLLAVKGEGPKALECLEKSVLAPHLEPLIVALRVLGGQEVSAPVEIEEVAKDIVRQIREGSNVA